MKIVLIGFACCYKTSAGKLLAAKLNYRHYDTDKAVEESVGKSVADIFAVQGERFFRVKEREALLAAAQCGDAVVSCGGGAVLCPDFCKLADCSTVVWLTAAAQTVCSRLSGGRPLFDGKSAEDIARLMEERAPFYGRYADFTVATDNLTSADVADELFNLINQSKV